METQSILKSKVSLCKNIYLDSYKTITLFDALNSIRKNIYGYEIDALRQLYTNGSLKSYKSKKKQLPAYIFSGIAGGRHKFDISCYTSLLVVDIDHPENMDEVIGRLKADSHIISLWKSPSGDGLKVLLYLEYLTPIKTEDIWIMHEHCAFHQVLNYFLENYKIKIDRSGSDITRLCFVSADPDIHLKKSFEPFPIQITLNKKQMWKLRAKYYYGSKRVRKAVAEMKKIAKLINVDY